MGMLLALTVSAPLLAAAPQDGPAGEPRWEELSTREILHTVARERDAVDPRAFEVLADRGDADAWDALRRSAGIVFDLAPVDAVFDAIATFTTHPELAEDVRAWLGEQVMGRPIEMQRGVGPAWHTMRAATRALARSGSAARAELGRIVRDHGDPVCREIAVGGLVPALRTAGDAESLELLLEHYRVPTSGSRELCVRTLRGFDTEDAYERLRSAVGRRDLPVQMKAMVVEAHATVPAERAEPLLVDALRSGEPALQLAAIEALGARGATFHYRELERLERSKHPALRRAALAAQARFRAEDEAWTERVHEAAVARDFARRLGAVEALSRMRAPSALDALHVLSSDESHLVREAAARALGRMRRKASIPCLIARLDGDSLRVRAAAHESLVAITGLDHGPTVVRWRAWWEGEGERFAVPPPEEVAAAVAARERRRRENPTQTEFYGIGIDSDRVCFVLDTSGSMEEVMRSGRTRLEAAADELAEALAGLPEGGRFNVVFFSDRVRAWRERMVARDGESLERASQFAQRQRPVGATALHDGLLRAFDDEDVDTIVLLSDGEPTDGELVEPGEILEDLELRNALRGVVVHCVSVNRASPLLQGLAASTGGTYREVE